jgi:hypothetical protein
MNLIQQVQVQCTEPRKEEGRRKKEGREEGRMRKVKKVQHEGD